MGCTYKINSNGKVYDTYQELADTVANSGKLDKISDIVYSDLEKQQTTKSILLKELNNDVIQGQYEEIKELNELREIYDGLDDSFISDLGEDKDEYFQKLVDEIKSRPTKAISAIDLIDNYQYPDPNNPSKLLSMATHLKLADYKKNKLEEFIKGGATSSEAHNKFKELMNGWKVARSKATIIHEMINNFGNKPKNFDNFDANTKNSCLKFMEAIKMFEQEIYNKYGSDAQIISQPLNISAKLNLDNKILIDKLKWVIIDSKGQVHLNMFKVTTTEFQDVKMKKYDYQLALRRQMLAKAGIDCKKMDLNFIPIKLSLNNDEISDIEMSKSTNRILEANELGSISPLTWKYGSYSKVVDKLIDIKPIVDVTNLTVLEDIQSDLNKMFPVYKLDLIRKSVTVDGFISKMVYDSKVEGYRYEFKGIDNKIVRIKEIKGLSKSQNTDLREAVENYLEARKLEQNGGMGGFAAKVSAVIKGTEDINTLNSKYMINCLQKYVSNKDNPKWELLDIPMLEDLNILAIANINTKQIDFINLTYLNTAQPVKLTFGKTILGEHLRDSNVNLERVLQSTNGNLDLMKVMAILNRVPELFNGSYSVGQIRVINPRNSIGVWATPAQLTTSFSQLCAKADIINNFSEDKINFVNPLIQFQQEFLSLMPRNTINSAVNNSIFSIFDTINFEEKENNIQALKELRSKMVETNPRLNTANSRNIALDRDPSIQLYYLVGNAIDYLQNKTLYQVASMSNFEKNFRTADTISDRNVRRITETITDAFTEITEEFDKFARDLREDVIYPLHENKNYSKVQNALLGNQIYMFKNMFKRNLDNSLNNQMLFENPYDMSSNLNTEEREFLKNTLYQINKWRLKRNGITLNGINDPRIKEFSENRNDWFNVPLERASEASRYQQGKYKDWANRSMKAFLHPKEYFKETTEGVLTQFDEEVKNSMQDEFKMYNQFESSENEEARANMLAKYDSSYWESNIENILLDYEFAHIRKEKLDVALAECKWISVANQIYAQENGVDIKVNEAFLEDYLKLAVYNKSIISESLQGVAQVAQKAKYLGSVVTLGMNTRGGVRDMLEGMWKYTTRSLTGLGTDVNKHDLKKALKIMFGEVGNYPTNVTLIEALNVRTRMANIDINKVAKELRTGKRGAANFMSQELFWFNMAPDYFNRMTMFVAQMIHDGSWDAMSMVGEKLSYDWKKDKRFSEFAKGNTSHPDYNKQKGDYYSNIRIWNEEHSDKQLTYDDALPFPYSKKRTDGLKKFSDTVFGYYDHESRMQSERGFIGMMCMQFKTFASGTIKNWTLSPNYYNMGQQQQATNLENGNLLYWDLEKGDITEIDTEIPYYTHGDSFMQGLLYTLKDTFKICAGLENGTFKDDIWNNPMQRANLNQLGADLLKWVILALLGGMAVEGGKEILKANQKGKQLTWKDVGINNTYDFLTKAYLGSTTDFNPIGTAKSLFIDIEPPTFAILGKFAVDGAKYVSGNMDTPQFLTRNVGCIRSHKAFFLGADEILKDPNEIAEEKAERRQKAIETKLEQQRKAQILE